MTEQGLARTFQNIRLFPTMTVLENVMIGRHCRAHAGIVGAIFRNKSTVKEEKAIVDDSYLILEKLELTEYVNELAMNMPMVPSAGSKLPGPWPPSRFCCFWTSPLPV